jgi:hypothetical protein
MGREKGQESMLRTEENIMKLTKKGEGEGEMKI